MNVADRVIDYITHACLARRNVSHAKKAKPSQINTKLAARSGVNPNPPHYTAAKGGMLALTRQAARELGAYGITVNAVAPANVQTPRTRGIRTPERIAHIERTTPLGRLAEPQEIANAVVWLASPQASYVTGTTMDVNGGATMI